MTQDNDWLLRVPERFRPQAKLIQEIADLGEAIAAAEARGEPTIELEAAQDAVKRRLFALIEELQRRRS